MEDQVRCSKMILAPLRLSCPFPSFVKQGNKGHPRLPCPRHVAVLQFDHGIFQPQLGAGLAQVAQGRLQPLANGKQGRRRLRQL